MQAVEEAKMELENVKKRHKAAEEQYSKLKKEVEQLQRDRGRPQD